MMIDIAEITETLASLAESIDELSGRDDVIVNTTGLTLPEDLPASGWVEIGEKLARVEGAVDWCMPRPGRRRRSVRELRERVGNLQRIEGVGVVTLVRKIAGNKAELKSVCKRLARINMEQEASLNEAVRIITEDVASRSRLLTLVLCLYRAGACSLLADLLKQHLDFCSDSTPRPGNGLQDPCDQVPF